jgi:formyl-CoA transferase
MMDRMRYREQPPAGGILGWGDHASAMSLFGAVMMGLYRRERSGRGGKVSTSLLANGIWANGIPLQARLSGAEVGLETPRLEMDNALAVAYETRDGHWFYPWMFDEERDWARFVVALGLPGLCDDPRFAATPARRAHAAELIALIGARVAAEDWSHWSTLLPAAGIDLISVNTLDDVIADPQVIANAGLVALENVPGNATHTINSPVFVEGERKRPAGPAPELGQHSIELLAELGYDTAQIAALKAAGALG